MTVKDSHNARSPDVARGKDWHGRTVFVTGGTGLVGSWLVKELLRAGARVVALVKELDPRSEVARSGDIHRVTVVHGRLEDYSILEHAINLYETDTVFHLGAQTLVGVADRSPLATFESNIRGTYNLFEACRIHRSIVKRIVFASTDKAYGEKDVLPYTEDMSLDARHAYDVSKSCGDLLGQAYARTYELPIAITRFGNVYGGGDLNFSRIVPGTILSLLDGNRPILRSDGTMTRDYLHVEDVVRGYMTLGAALDNPKLWGEAFNFSNGNQVSVLDVVKCITRLLGREDLPPDIRNTARHEIPNQTLSSEKALKVLGWKAELDLEAGLERTVAWYRSYREAAFNPIAVAQKSSHG